MATHAHAPIYDLHAKWSDIMCYINRRTTASLGALELNAHSNASYSTAVRLERLSMRLLFGHTGWDASMWKISHVHSLAPNIQSDTQTNMQAENQHQYRGDWY